MKCKWLALLMAIVYLSVNLLVDIAYSIADPRVVEEES